MRAITRHVETSHMKVWRILHTNDVYLEAQRKILDTPVNSSFGPRSGSYKGHCDVPVSKRFSLFQDKTRMSYGALAAGVRYLYLESGLWCHLRLLETMVSQSMSQSIPWYPSNYPKVQRTF
ncbi:hypothetical protein TNCV_1839531 [Trichonephila clavipes]|nr:hypothetical protein TNCV_1839531 [Trichonephila clavipes]